MGAGYRVVTACQGRQALERLASDRPALMMLDVMMPGMSGDDVLAELERRGQLRAIPIIVMSAGEGSPVAKRYGLPYLKKPSSIRAVLQLVSDSLIAPS